MSKWQWVQLLGFYGFWLLAVIGQNSWAWGLGLLLLGHFMLTPSRVMDMRILSLALLGLAVDGLLTVSGVFAFHYWPWWLVLLWCGFVVTLGHSLRWLKRLPIALQALLGAVAGPSSYITGWRLAAVDLPLGIWPSVAILAPVWACLLVTLVWLESKIRRSGYA